jgi:2-isopropylmalate synthase
LALVQLHDETLRDGLQSASVREPPIAERIELLERMAEVGIESANVAIPAVSRRHIEEAAEVCRAVAHLPLALTCAARTLTKDVAAVVEVSQRSGVAVEVAAFVGSSPIRAMIEGWDLAWLRAQVAEAMTFAQKQGLRACFVTEDTTRSPPGWLTPLFETALDHGATRLCICDTVGHATPDGVAALIGFVRSFLTSRGHDDVLLDWHGHDDRGLAIANSLAAVRAGVDRVHGTVLGIGERAGNACMELLLANLRPVTEATTAREMYRAVGAKALGVSWERDQRFTGRP